MHGSILGLSVFVFVCLCARESVFSELCDHLVIFLASALVLVAWQKQVEPLAC